MAAATTPRPPRSIRKWNAAPAIAAAIVLALSWVAALTPAAAQNDPFLNFRQQIRPKPPSAPSLLNKGNGDQPMLVKANEIDYDYANNRVAAVGNVQIYYNGATIEADRIVYDQ